MITCWLRGINTIKYSNVCHGHRLFLICCSSLTIFPPQSLLDNCFCVFLVEDRNFISLLGTIKSSLLTCPVRIRCYTALKRDRTCCVADIDSYNITKEILATCLEYDMSPYLSLAFGRCFPVFVNQKSSISNWICF